MNSPFQTLLLNTDREICKHPRRHLLLDSPTNESKTTPVAWMSVSDDHIDDLLRDVHCDYRLGAFDELKVLENVV